MAAPANHATCDRFQQQDLGATWRWQGACRGAANDLSRPVRRAQTATSAYVIRSFELPRPTSTVSKYGLIVLYAVYSSSRLDARASDVVRASPTSTQAPSQ